MNVRRASELLEKYIHLSPELKRMDQMIDYADTVKTSLQDQRETICLLVNALYLAVEDIARLDSELKSFNDSLPLYLTDTMGKADGLYQYYFLQALDKRYK